MTAALQLSGKSLDGAGNTVKAFKIKKMDRSSVPCRKTKSKQNITGKGEPFRACIKIPAIWNFI